MQPNNFTQIIRRDQFRITEWLCLCFLILLLSLLVSCSKEDNAKHFKTITINNSSPRVDADGKIVDAHDGCIQIFGCDFFLYGTEYGTNDGFNNSNRYVVYKSPDLSEWHRIGYLFKEQPTGVYYRPYVAYNAKTKKYVLWYNWYPKHWEGQTGVAVSDNPTGPFLIVNPNVKLACSHPGDGSLFVADDGQGYYIYNSIDDGYKVRVSKLTEDFLGITGETSDVVANGAEAPILFQKGGIFYAVVGELCPFCTDGAEAHVLASTSPLGPFDPVSNINRRPNSGVDMFTQPTTNTVSIQTKAPIIPGQQTWIARLPSEQGPLFMWMCDLWGSAPDGIKGHDIQYWSPPLEFNPTNAEIRPVKNALAWQIKWTQKQDCPPQIVEVFNIKQAEDFIQPDPIEGNNQAWVLATSPNPEKRNGELAVKLSESACRQTRFRITIFIGTLAAAYAEAGRFEDAVKTAEKACSLALEFGEAELLKRNQELLELYRNRQAFRENTQSNQ